MNISSCSENQQFAYYIFHYRRIHGKYPELPDYTGPVEGEINSVHVMNFPSSENAYRFAYINPQIRSVFVKHANNQRAINQWIIDQTRTESIGFFQPFYDKIEAKFHEYFTNNKVAILDSAPSDIFQIKSYRDLRQEVVLKNWNIKTVADDDLEFI